MVHINKIFSRSYNIFAVGKSSFMKIVAREFMELGYDVEMHYCSSDNNSLDGVVIKDAQIALIDGTAPHIVDPKNPGAVDEIINLGEYWNERGMISNKQEVLSCNKGVGDYFRSAYRYLAAAKEMQDDVDIIIDSAVDQCKFNKLLLALKNELVDNIEIKENTVSVRHLFDSAITPDGVVDYIQSIITDNHTCYYIKGDYSIGSTEILNKLAQEYALKGYKAELYHQPLNPDRLQTLVVDELNLAITVNHKLENRADKVIDLNDIIIASKLHNQQETVELNKEMLNTLLSEAVNRISKAKKLHDEMETYYISNMNFDAINEVRDKTIERIKGLIER